MARTNENFRVHQGEYQQVTITVLEQESLNPIDLNTVLSMTWEIYDPDTGEVLLTKDENDATISGSSSQIAAFDLFSDETSEWDIGWLNHEFRVELATSVAQGTNNKIIAAGTVEVLDSIEHQGRK